jgi:5-methylcytosine-specific restriction endonuclease McrA
VPVRGKTAGNKGHGSKWIVPWRRQAIYRRDRYHCVWCGSSQELTLDHVIPRSRNGKNETSNLITACMICNRQRGDLFITQFALELFGRQSMEGLLEVQKAIRRVRNAQRRKLRDTKQLTLAGIV